MKYLPGAVLLLGAAVIGYVAYRHIAGGPLKHPLKSQILAYPITRKVISSGFGKRKHPKTGKESFHNGIDIKTKVKNGVPDPDGTPEIGLHIFAPFDGKVFRKFTDEFGGLSLIIVSRDGWKMGFAHLLSAPVEVGEEFKAGDLIAASGNSGGSTGPHIHLTLRNPDDVIVDPAPFFGV